MVRIAAAVIVIAIIVVVLAAVWPPAWAPDWWRRGTRPLRRRVRPGHYRGFG